MELMEEDGGVCCGVLGIRFWEYSEMINECRRNNNFIFFYSQRRARPKTQVHVFRKIQYVGTFDVIFPSSVVG